MDYRRGGGAGGCCRCCFSFIFTLGLTALFLWLSLRTSKPTCAVQSIYFPALNRTLNNPKNTTVYLTLRLENGNKDKGIFYDNVNLTLSYIPNITDPKKIKLVNDTFVTAFYQGHKKTAKKEVNFSAAELNWTAARAVNSTTFFRVDLATAVRFKIMAWKTKRYRIMVGANVEVNEFGEKVKKKKKGIKLSGAGKNGGFSLKVGVLVNFLIWVLLSFW
ncbi:hypothetical protein L484_011901 [Morus notabilis]|uniref:Late embryogenesis abundant protein LEA-2 subgroup domain-containing protein n=1 Tax=Morus notabilis TaxID=981085 RepID=W9SGC5_9ROSA|nr:hypothetical protein L484_011901 [Morus notabilis]